MSSAHGNASLWRVVTLVSVAIYPRCRRYFSGGLGADLLKPLIIPTGARINYPVAIKAASVATVTDKTECSQTMQISALSVKKEASRTNRVGLLFALQT